MKPDWDKLMTNFNKGENAQHGLIADVDCTAQGKDLCQKHGVKGYPSIKWGDPDGLEDYDGGRDYNSLEKFAKSNIKPICSPANLDLCDDENKKKITELQALSAADLATKIEEKQKEMKEAEAAFEAGVEKLQATYEQLQKTKDETIAAVKSSGLGLMVSVQSHAKKAKQEL
eukprot:CAMPEP_0185901666 /NCGR_PEP_ID=MMETSP0196C-20130402/1015_1 /TAXON_ID=2932 /ORGANISM="Alexandrium fundyense, Strain CCMP1719" /LENGTH=171 /DNA_ID=CAMNT_0028620359 /DNA_START=101 /DNA_END=616 /DNA_ORIENTATION=+